MISIKSIVVTLILAALLLYSYPIIFQKKENQMIPSPTPSPTTTKKRVSVKVTPNITPSKEALNYKKTFDYLCSGRIPIKVEYTYKKATIKFSDGKSYALQQVPATSGVRYATSEYDDSIVFWIKPNSAYLRENDNIKYVCFAEKK